MLSCVSNADQKDLFVPSTEELTFLSRNLSKGLAKMNEVVASLKKGLVKNTSTII
jgi:hypothetical protein